MVGEGSGFWGALVGLRTGFWGAGVRAGSFVVGGVEVGRRAEIWPGREVLVGARELGGVFRVGFAVE